MHVSIRMQTSRFGAIPGLVLALVWCAACREAGFRPDEVPVHTARIDLAIGQLDGGDAYLFGLIAGLAIDDAGRIYVADQQAHTVRVFGQDGAHLRSLGREGSGPAELRQPCCLGISPDGLLWVRDNGNNRYVSFDVAGERGEPGPTIRMQHTDVNRWASVTFDETGRLIDVGSRPDAATGQSRTFRFHVTAADAANASSVQAVPTPVPPEGAVAVSRVSMQRGEVLVTRYVYQPFGARHLLAYGPRGVFADAVSGKYAISVYASDGAVRHTIVRDDYSAGPPLTSEQRAAGDSSIARDARFIGRDPGAMPFAVPQRHPPIAELLFDDGGRLWVRLTTLPRSRDERTCTTPTDPTSRPSNTRPASTLESPVSSGTTNSSER